MAALDEDVASVLDAEEEEEEEEEDDDDEEDGDDGAGGRGRRGGGRGGVAICVCVGCSFCFVVVSEGGLLSRNFLLIISEKPPVGCAGTGCG